MTKATAVAQIQTERRFFTGMAIAMALFVFIGFAPTYYLYPVIGVEPLRGAEPLTPMVHLHAATGTAWMLFLVLQTGLIMGGQPTQHMRNGIIGIALAVAIIVLGVAVAIYSARVGRTPPGWTPTGFMAIPLASVTLFGGFVTAALLWRWRPDFHKRLMLIGTTALLVPAGARFSHQFLDGLAPPGPVGGMILSDFFLAALVIYDLRMRGRLHPATLWGGGIVLVSQPLRVMLSDNPAFNRFAAWMIG
ncbi:MAG TPA: hypothetical protein VFK50_01370 [Sphingomicrobium sp.]|nr:hypothetical protein [Sphingomicrobium sp.]